MSMHHSIAYRLVRIYWRLFRPLTLGSRAIVVRDDQALLVRLSYAKGWYLPGGGVDRRESFRACVIRELREECGIETSSPELFGLYFTTKQNKTDHVAIYVVREFTMPSMSSNDPEIAEMRFFPLDALPEATSPATRRRIEEWRSGRPASSEW